MTRELHNIVKLLPEDIYGKWVVIYNYTPSDARMHTMVKSPEDTCNKWIVIYNYTPGSTKSATMVKLLI